MTQRFDDQKRGGEKPFYFYKKNKQRVVPADGTGTITDQGGKEENN